MVSLRIPLDRLHADGANGGDHMVVILAEGAANKRRTSPCERLELIVAGIHIFDDLLRRQRIVVVVCVGMVHQLAAAVYDGLGLLRILVRSVADHEKGRLDAVVREYIQDLLRVVRPPMRHQRKCCTPSDRVPRSRWAAGASQLTSARQRTHSQHRKWLPQPAAQRQLSVFCAAGQEIAAAAPPSSRASLSA